MSLLGQLLAVFGGLIFLTAAVNLVRLPDVYTRVSALTTAAGFGLGFVTVGALLVAPTVTDTVKVVLAVLLQLATSAVAGMYIARSAYLTGTPLAEHTRYDELATSALTGEDEDRVGRDGRRS
ncbi:MAG TPA: monovalent cation/H(+) antiporter subunit G [Actinomycetospora sp.]|nr:monovalent cation/H(+) antiporter subunit G [Actinomycetospora sp.]